MDKKLNHNTSQNGNAADAGLEQMLKSLPPDLAQAALKGLGVPDAENTKTSNDEQNDKIENNVKSSENAPLENDFDFNESDTIQDIFAEDKALEHLQEEVTTMFSDKLSPEAIEESQQKEEEKSVMDTISSVDAIKFRKKNKFDVTRLLIYLVTGLIIGIMAILYVKMNDNLNAQSIMNEEGNEVNYHVYVDSETRKKIKEARERRVKKIEDPIEKYNYYVKKGHNYEAIKYLAELIESQGKDRSAILEIINKLPKNSDKNIKNALRRVNEAYDHKEPIILSMLATRENDPDKKADILKDIMATKSGNANAGIQLIQYYYNNNELEKALKMCQNVISFNLDVPFSVIEDHAELLVLKGKEKQAQKFLEKIMEKRGGLNREEQLIYFLNVFMLAKDSKYVDRYLTELSRVSDKKQLKRYFGLYRNAVFSSIDHKKNFKNDRDWDYYSKPFYVVSLMAEGKTEELSMLPTSKEEYPAIYNIYANWNKNTLYWQDNATLVATKKFNKDKVDVLFCKLIMHEITDAEYLQRGKFIPPTLKGKFYFLIAEYFSKASDKKQAKMYYEKSIGSPGNIYQSVAKARIKKLSN